MRACRGHEDSACGHAVVMRTVRVGLWAVGMMDENLVRLTKDMT